MAEVLPTSICIPSCLILKQELGGSLVVMGDVIITVNTWMAGLGIFQADGPTRESKNLIYGIIRGRQLQQINSTGEKVWTRRLSSTRKRIFPFIILMFSCHR